MVFTAVYLSTPSKFELACTPLPFAQDFPPGAHLKSTKLAIEPSLYLKVSYSGCMTIELAAGFVATPRFDVPVLKRFLQKDCYQQQQNMPRP